MGGASHRLHALPVRADAKLLKGNPMWETVKSGGRLAVDVLAAAWVWTAEKVGAHPNKALAAFLVLLIISFWF